MKNKLYALIIGQNGGIVKMNKYKKMWYMLLVRVAENAQVKDNEGFVDPSDVYTDILASMARIQAEVMKDE